MTLTPAVRALLDRALALTASERGQVFGELFDSLAGHDEMELLVDELDVLPRAVRVSCFTGT